MFYLLNDHIQYRLLHLARLSQFKYYLQFKARQLFANYWTGCHTIKKKYENKTKSNHLIHFGWWKLNFYCGYVLVVVMFVVFIISSRCILYFFISYCVVSYGMLWYVNHSALMLFTVWPDSMVRKSFLCWLRLQCAYIALYCTICAPSHSDVLKHFIDNLGA